MAKVNTLSENEPEFAIFETKILFRTYFKIMLMQLRFPTVQDLCYRRTTVDWDILFSVFVSFMSCQSVFYSNSRIWPLMCSFYVLYKVKQ